MDKKVKIIVILGQTSTGKSDFAVDISLLLRSGQAQKGEIISADSRQVYKGMNLGTGKITKKEMRGIPHHLVDVVSPNTDFSVSKFKKLADKKIKEMVSRGNIPIICGGTGFYIDAVIDNTILPEVKPDKELRIRLNKKSTSELFIMLEKLDPERAKNIDKNNPVRLIRAIEIAKALGSVPAISHRSDLCKKYDVLKIGLTLPDETLKERIYKRILMRIKKGMFKEFENLHKNGLSYKKMDKFGLEYKYGAQYLKKEINKKDFIEKLNIDTWHYAKRQKTWFKRDKNTIWINPLDKNDIKNIDKRIKDFIKN